MLSHLIAQLLHNEDGAEMSEVAVVLALVVVVAAAGFTLLGSGIDSLTQQVAGFLGGA